jgi:nucleoid-associated protein YgaU
VVAKNDSLWGISVKIYNDGYKWTKIWELNKKVIKNPGVIYTGTKLILPSLGS